MKKKALSILLATAMTSAMLAGCGSGSAQQSAPAQEAAPAAEAAEAAEEQAAPAEEAPKAELQTEATSEDVVSAHVDVVNLASERDPTDMGPWAGNMGGASGIIPLVYQSLQIRELNKDPEPCLAKSVEVVDEKTYNIELFDYIYDTEGNQLTANVIKFGVEKAKEIGKDNTAKAVDSIEVTGDYTFTVHFGERAAMGDYEGFLTQLKFVTQAAYEAEGNNMSQHPIGTGPYIMSNYVSGSVIEFTKNPNYWQTDEQYIARSSEAHADQINYQIITEALQRAIAIENGSLDYGGVTLNDKERLAAEGFGIVPIPDNLTYMMFANMDETSYLAGNKDLREAIFYALDNESISALFTSQDSVPVYDLSNSNYPDYYGDYYKSEDNIYKYDPDKAMELVASSGYDGRELTIITSSDEASTEMAQIIVQFLNTIGVNAKIDSYQSQLMGDIAADPAKWDLYILQYASTDYSVNVWEKVLNRAKYKWDGTINFVFDDELQNKLAEVRTPAGHTEENVKALHDYIADQAWAIGLVQGIPYYACSSKFDAENVVFSEQRVIRPNASIYK